MLRPRASQPLNRRHFLRATVTATVGFVAIARELLTDSPAFADPPMGTCNTVYCEPEGVYCDPEDCILYGVEYCYDSYTHEFCYIRWYALGYCH